MISHFISFAVGLRRNAFNGDSLVSIRASYISDLLNYWNYQVTLILITLTIQYFNYLKDITINYIQILHICNHEY